MDMQADFAKQLAMFDDMDRRLTKLENWMRAKHRKDDADHFHDFTDWSVGEISKRYCLDFDCKEIEMCGGSRTPHKFTISTGDKFSHCTLDMCEVCHYKR